ncbi:MAG TPA: fumarylacetoacetate hydrolase family protein [Alphaproteobacteria bacterium]
MSADDRIERAAQFFWADRLARRRYRNLPPELRPRTIAETYAAQEALQALIGGRLGAVAGYKIALTSPAMRHLLRVDEPFAAAIFADTVHASPAAVRAGDFVSLGIECELAVRLDRDLPAAGAPYDRATVAEAVGACMAAFELVDDRNADYGALDVPSCIADNGWNAGVVLGPPHAGWRALDLAGAAGRLEINGRPAGSGKAGDVMGHPFEALAWLANFHAGRGRGLTRGAIVMTGSIVQTLHLAPGDRATFSFDGLDAVALDVSS